IGGANRPELITTLVDSMGALQTVDVNHDGRNDGDTNKNGVLDPGETWHYTLDYAATQGDIDSNGDGDGAIENVAAVVVKEANGGHSHEQNSHHDHDDHKHHNDKCDPCEDKCSDQGGDTATAITSVAVTVDQDPGLDIKKIVTSIDDVNH